MKASKYKGDVHAEATVRDSSDADAKKESEGGETSAGQGPADSAAGTGEVTSGPEAGYGAETHPRGSDFSHRTAWRRKADAQSGRAPAGKQSVDEEKSDDEDVR